MSNVQSGNASQTSNDSGAKNAKILPEPQMADFRAPKLPDFHSVARFGCGIPQNCQFGHFLPIFVQIISNISDISTHFSICTDFNLKCI